MTNANATKEPTPDQLALMGSLELRARSAFNELDEINKAVSELDAQGVPGARWMDFFVDGELACLHVVRTLRVSGGRWGFSEWWFYRVHGDDTLKYAIEACDHEQAAALRAVEKAVALADPGLIAVLNRAAGDSYTHNEQEYARRAGMTRSDVEARAEAVITALIESGWRP